MAIEKIVQDGDTFVHTYVEDDAVVDSEEIDTPNETIDEDGNVVVEAEHAPKYTQKIKPDAKAVYKGELDTDPEYAAVVSEQSEEKRG